jgi:hypothetical protein
MMDRRTALKAGIALALTSHTPAVAEEPKAISIDDFLARATPAERATYHASALSEAMDEVHPGIWTQWFFKLDHEHGVALIWAEKRVERT